MSYIIQNQEFVIGILFSALGVLVSIYLYYIGKKYRQIAYTCQTLNVSFLDNPISNIKFNPTYKEKELDNLSITDLIIWSKGKTVINPSDIAPKFPLSVFVPNGSEILEYQVMYENEAANNFNLSVNEERNQIELKFDYISYKNGLALRVIHTGNYSGHVYVDCRLKDGKKLLHVYRRKGFLYKLLNNHYIKNILSSKITSFLFIFFTLVLFPIAFVQSANYASNNFFGLPESNVFMNLDSIIIFILCSASFIFTIPHVYNLFKTEPPKDLLNRTSCEK